MLRIHTAVATLGLLAAAALAPAVALAGGNHVVVHAPEKAGGPLRLERSTCGEAGTFAVTAEADLVVDGVTRTVKLAPEPTSSPQWLEVRAPREARGAWVLRVRASGGHAATTVVRVDAGGRPGRGQFAFDGDGRRESAALLAAR